MVIKFLLFLPLTLSAGDTCQPAFYLSRYPDSVIEKCNTARHITTLSNTEKEVILFTNLVRYNPSLFLEKVAKPFIEHCYLKHIEYDPRGGHIESLYEDLKRTPPVPLLKTEPVLNETAADHAGYCSRTGSIGHDNFKQRWETIKKKLGHIKAGENCNYLPSRFNNGLFHVISLLIDEDSPIHHGHREAILYKSYQYTGVAIRPFPNNRQVLVQHFSLKTYSSTP
jgi:hypothetical protein